MDLKSYVQELIDDTYDSMQVFDAVYGVTIYATKEPDNIVSVSVSSDQIKWRTFKFMVLEEDIIDITTDETTAVNRGDKWDRRFLRIAKEVSTWSKDPSTKVGAVIVDENKNIVSTGFNGFPAGCDFDYKLHDRDFKLPLIIHAEENAILHANKRYLDGCTIYVTQPPCKHCVSLLAQKKIGRIISLGGTEEFRLRWNTSDVVALAKRLGISLEFLEDTE